MIGKTRQQAEVQESFDEAAGKPRGVLRGPAPAGKFRHGRHSASPDLAHAIDHYWMVSWDLRGEKPHLAETLPHPNFNLVFEKPVSTINGVFTGKFSRRLEGQGQAFGIKFKPGAFRPLVNASASSFANRSIPAASLFAREEVEALEAVLISSAEDDKKVEAADTFLRRHITGPDATVLLATDLVQRILNEREIRTVEDLSMHAGITRRSLQRLFREYVGAPPKWVIRRYRLHELVEQLHDGRSVDYASLALDLGYFDQAHLIRDFRSIVGYSPGQYGKRTADPQ
jgi:AraC-like DNA-binding protein